MIYIYTALHGEAKPFLQKLKLKREKSSFGFEVYSNEELQIRLVITGVGQIAAATGVGASMGYYHGGEEDFLVNIGSCAGTGEKGTVTLCNKLTDRTDGYTFYPDILFGHPFRETHLVTQQEVFREGFEMVQDADTVFDMEGAAIYRAASYFVGPHQICFLKVISDAGDGEKVSPVQLREIMNQAADSIVDFLFDLKQYWDGISKQESVDMTFQKKEKLFDTLSQEFCCSETMKNQLKQCTKYWTLSGIDYEKMISEMRMEGSMPCKDRREGKKRLEELFHKSFTV
jgi:hypothetical protein